VRGLEERGLLRVGHGGASGVVRGNTPESFDAALDLGVDVIEFDVRAWQGRLVLAHTMFHAGWVPRVSLDRALAHLAQPRFSDVGLNVDVKHVGCEAALLDALRRRDLLGRTIVSSQVRAVLDRVRALDPSVRTGMSVGGVVARRSCLWRDWRAEVLEDLRRERYDALMAYHRLVDARLVSDVRERCGAVFAWTIKDAAALMPLRAAAVDGVITVDPRLLLQP
jgi:glycerophosphoryl diester phosphodiesterase